jgi:NAD dependent epimerase/dehydratase family enzyme
MPTVLIAGGTGTIGKRLNELLIQKGYSVIILTRHISKKQTNGSGTGYARWDIDKGEIDNEAVKKADYIINLAGAGVAEKDGPTIGKERYWKAGLKPVPCW